MHSQYLTYAEYQNLGGKAEETAFPLLEVKARKRIDNLTFCRVQNMESVPDSVKMCMACLINMEDVVGAEQQATNPQLTSYNTDGYSESYGNALNADEASKQMNKQIVAMLFGERDDNGVPLLYQGVRG